MGKQTTIAWTSSTVNLAWGCTKITTGCRNCYMFRLSKIYGRDPESVQLLTAGLNAEAFSKKVREAGKYIFINSMSDTFHNEITDRVRENWFSWMGSYPEKQFQVLTKRIDRAYDYFQSHDCPLNVWIGCSVENKITARERIPVLQKITKPLIRFVSFEPLLSSVCDDNEFIDLDNIQWVIVGGESDAKNPRPMDSKWAEQIRRVCKGSKWHKKIPFFFKQMGGVGGDGAGGSFLNFREYKEMPL